MKQYYIYLEYLNRIVVLNIAVIKEALILNAFSYGEFIALNKHPSTGCSSLVLNSHLSQLKQCMVSCSRAQQTGKTEDLDHRTLYRETNILSTRQICPIINVFLLLRIVYMKIKYNYTAEFSFFSEYQDNEYQQTL